MKNIKNSLLILLSLIFFSACTEDADNPFKGGNNYITSFDLTIGGVKYPAEIIGNDIVLTVPKNIEFSGVEVNYTLSENATLLPDPLTIENWNEEHIFRINAWNNEFVSYKFKLDKKDVIESNDVVLLTQNDVEEFAKKRISSIEGNLIIGQQVMPISEFDTIKNLNSLKSLEYVSLNIVVNNSFCGDNFNGLKNLKSIGGLYIGSSLVESKVSKALEIELPNLVSANKIVINSDSLKQLVLPNMSIVGELNICSNQLHKLLVSKLETCSGDLLIKAVRANDHSGKKANNILTDIKIPNLVKVTGNFEINNFWKLTSLNIDNLKQVGGDFNLSFIKNISEINIKNLESVEGKYIVQSNDAMTKFKSPKLKMVALLSISSLNSYSMNLELIELPFLENVEKDLVIKYASVKSLDIPKLVNIGGAFELNGLTYIESVNLPEIVSCEEFKISGSGILSTFVNPKLTALNKLELIKCNRLLGLKVPNELVELSLDFGDKKSEFPNLEGLSVVKGQFKVSGFKNNKLELKEITEIGDFNLNYVQAIKILKFPKLAKVNKSFVLSSLDSITQFHAPKLESIGENFTIKGCYELLDIDLSKLSTIGQKFTFYGGSWSAYASKSKTEHLNAFSSITNAGAVLIRYAGNLVDFSGLKNLIPNISEADWKVLNCKYNPTYQDMVDGNYSN